MSICVLCLGKEPVHSDTCPRRATATAALLEHLEENEEELTQGEKKPRLLPACSCGRARTSDDPALRAAGNSSSPNVFVFAPRVVNPPLLAAHAKAEADAQPFEVRACRGCGVVYVPAEALARAP